MNIHPTITIYEMATILREHLETKFGAIVDQITVTSYDTPRVTVEYSNSTGGDSMVEAIAFRHRTQK